MKTLTSDKTTANCAVLRKTTVSKKVSKCKWVMIPTGNCSATWQGVTRQKCWANPHQPVWQIHQITLLLQQHLNACLCCHSKELCSFISIVSWRREMLTAHQGPIYPEPISSQSILLALWDRASVAEENKLFTFFEAHWSHQMHRINLQCKSMGEPLKSSCLLLQKQARAPAQRECTSIYSWKESSNEKPGYSPGLMGSM